MHWHILSDEFHAISSRRSRMCFLAEQDVFEVSWAGFYPTIEIQARGWASDIGLGCRTPQVNNRRELKFHLKFYFSI